MYSEITFCLSSVEYLLIIYCQCLGNSRNKNNINLVRKLKATRKRLVQKFYKFAKITSQRMLRFTRSSYKLLLITCVSFILKTENLFVCSRARCNFYICFSLSLSLVIYRSFLFHSHHSLYLHSLHCKCKST